MEVLLIPIFIIFLFFLIAVAISRWVFRINKIVNTLESILNALSVGFDLAEIKKRKDISA